MNSNKSTAELNLLPPETILQSRYRIVRQLGRGGMGAVYEAIDLRLDHTVAVKQTLTQDESLWKQFEREARLMARLNHPVLPRVSDYFTEGRRAFFVMQYVAGADLAQIIAQQPGPLPQRSVVAWADQLLDALIYLHSHDRQIVHRDIKPHNLKITPTGKIVLLDFGLAKSDAADGYEPEFSRSIFGYSPRYAPLEQIQDLGTSPQSDIYALGATLYHLLTGIKPPDAVTRATALISSMPNPLRPAHEINPAVEPALSAILNRAMEQNPSHRYQSAAEFREALRQVGRVESAATHRRGERERFVFGPDDIDQVAADGGYTTVVGSTRKGSPRMVRHIIAVAFVILLAGFGVFCRYYPWKLPTAPTAEPAVTSAAVSLFEPEPSAIDHSHNSSPSRPRK